jgi:hypothetical protein
VYLPSKVIVLKPVYQTNGCDARVFYCVGWFMILESHTQQPLCYDVVMILNVVYHKSEQLLLHLLTNCYTGMCWLNACYKCTVLVNMCET